ncbi:MAG: cupin domain-containing protein, partial [Sulfurospirillaceae bacterium]|nr:cupin domain-containing protein [Sulfurospirillaceae bacterium]
MKVLWFTMMMVILSVSAMAAEAKGVSVDVLAKSTLSWDGSAMPAYPKGEPEVTVLKIAIPPHVTLPMHMHPLINAGVLLAGELTVITDEKKTLHLKAGEALIEVVNKWHYGINEGDVPAVIVVF